MKVLARVLVGILFFAFVFLIADFVAKGQEVPVLLMALPAYLLVSLLFGFLSASLAEKKNYAGYFWMGFLLGFIGLVYVAGLPMNPKARVNPNARANPNARRQNVL